jgi:hypothetical protein
VRVDRPDWEAAPARVKLVADLRMQTERPKSGGRAAAKAKAAKKAAPPPEEEEPAVVEADEEPVAAPAAAAAAASSSSPSSSSTSKSKTKSRATPAARAIVREDAEPAPTPPEEQNGAEHDEQIAPETPEEPKKTTKIRTKVDVVPPTDTQELAEEGEESEEERANPYVLDLLADEGEKLKSLFDMLNSLMGEELYLLLTWKGVYYSAADKQGLLVAQFHLEADKLTKYRHPGVLKTKDDCMVVTVLTKDMSESIKAKPKETVRMFILKSDRNTLCIDITNKQSNSVTSNKIRLGGDTGFVPIDVPQYPESLRPVAKIGGKDFGEKCKTLTKFGKQATLAAQAEGVCMDAGTPETKQTTPKFGSWVEGAPPIFRGVFPSSMISQVGKCGGNTKQVLVYACRGKPLKIMADVGSYGVLYLHLYSKTS